MTIRTTGAISIDTIRAEFGTHVNSLSQLYYTRAPAADTNKAAGVTDDTLPTSGPISFSNFYGKSYKYLELYQSGAAYTYTYISGYYYGYGCFPADARVNTPEGYKNIKDLNIGDEIIAVNYRTEVPYIGVKKVEKVLIHQYSRTKNKEIMMKVTPTNGEPFLITHNHPVMFCHNKEDYEESFNNIGDLKSGDVILNKDLKEVIIEKIESIDYDTDKIYNLEVEDYNTFLVNDIIVHNGGSAINNTKKSVANYATAYVPATYAYRTSVLDGTIR